MKTWQQKKREQREARLKEIEAHPELRDAHAKLLDVIADKEIGALSAKMDVARVAIRKGDLKMALATLQEFGRANTRVQTQLKHSAEQLGIDVHGYDDSDDDDDDDE